MNRYDDPSPASLPPPVAERILPQYSFRFVAIGMTFLAFAAFVFRRATQGSALAEAIVYASAVIIGCFLLQAILFVIALVPARIGRDKWQDIGQGNPFADGQLPPQWLPPDERSAG